jgi:hypothetical protein
MPAVASLIPAAIGIENSSSACNSYSDAQNIAAARRADDQINARCRSTPASTTANAVMFTMRRTVADEVRI